MTPEQIERVFGRARLQMVTGKHVEVFREAVGVGRRRKYTKRFLNTLDADFGQWTEREWRILARLFGHGIDCVPEVVQFDRGDAGGTQLVQTYDAGATVDQWATILPVTRGGRVLGHVFEDCAHWWALAQHCLRVLQAIHELSVVHLDIKGDNVCIPVGPPDFDPNGRDLHFFPRFDKLALIDFAFALVSRESLTTALPIGWQTDYDYQSPRLLHALEAGRRGDLQPTRDLDWRCDMYSLAAMLKRYLPVEDVVLDAGRNCGWSSSRATKARELILALREAHDREATLPRPHQALIDLAAACLAEQDMAASLAAGWTLALDAHVTPVAPTALTPLTRLAPTLRVLVTPRVVVTPRGVVPPTVATVVAIPSTIRRRVPALPAPSIASPASPRTRWRAFAAMVLAVAPLGAALGLVAPDVVARWPNVTDGMRAALQRLPFGEPAPRDALFRTEASVRRADVAAPTAASTPTTVGTAPPDVAPSGVSPSPGEATATTPESPTPALQVAGDEAKREALPTEKVATEARDPELRTNVTSDAEARPGKSSPAASAVVALRPLPASPSTAGALAPTARETKPASVPPQPAMLARTRPPAAASPPSKGSVQVATGPAPARVRFFNDLPAKRSAPAIAAAPAGPAAPPAPVVADAVVPEAALAQPVQEEPAVAAPRPAALPPSQLAAKPSAASPPAPAQTRGLVELLLSFAQRSDQRKAPIEDRSSAPLAARAPPPARVPPLAAARAPDDAAALVRSPTDAANAATTAVPEAAPIVGHISSETASPPAVTFPASRPPVPRPRPLPPVAATERIPESVAAAPDLAEQAQRSLAYTVPYSASRAQSEVARVLWVAANAHTPMQERSIIEAVQRAWSYQQVATTAGHIAPGVARQLAEEARQAYVNERNVRRAVDLQLRAFGANPRDPEVAGNLAYLYLKVSPAQPEVSRQLVLHAMALGSLSRRATRVDDWNTLAVASALTRRDADAINAFYVVLALTRDLDRSCKEALTAVDNHGGNLVIPVQTMMARIRQQGRNIESPNCAWPVHWRTARR